LGSFSSSLISMNDASTTQPIVGWHVPAEHPDDPLVYFVSGTGDAAENARSNVARSALGKSETAM
jgi:hypothetical protein